MMKFFKSDGGTISPFVAFLYVLAIVLLSPVILVVAVVIFVIRGIWLTVKGIGYFGTFFLGGIFYRK